jgi:nicotinate phosphoribosyltransferase
MVYLASPEDIRDGKVTDVYFLRTRQILEAEGIDKRVLAEFVVKSLPGDAPWGVFAGLEECVEFLKQLDVDVWALPEGTIFPANTPVMMIEGSYLEFGIYETAILGMICQASGVATKAARCRKAAGDRPVISFGARRMHPSIAPMIERNAFIAGCDGVATVIAAEKLGLQPVGTIPHALILILGDTVEAVKAFDRVIDPKVNRVALIDTFNDEKFEALRVAEALGKRLHAIRLDTPGNRRGDMVGIMQEVRWELDLRGHEHVKIFLSGGLDERRILEYNEVADAYGVGTAISNAPVLDYAMDIVEIEGEPIAKRGKPSGRKNVLRCVSCYRTEIVPANRPIPERCVCGGRFEGLVRKFVGGRELLQPMPSAAEIRSYVLSQLEHFDLEPL